jgi:hypothetical protein
LTGEPPFHVYMGLVDAEGVPTSNATSLIGTMNGIFQVNLSAFPLEYMEVVVTKG